MSLTRIGDDFTGYFDGIEKEEITMPDGTKEYKYDRAKDARFQANMMLSLNTSGLVSNITDCFKIVPGSGLSVIRLPGEGWLDGHFAYLMYQQNITLPENNQIYYYIIRCMSDAENRCMYEGVLMNPDVSTLPVRTVNTFDLVVAKIEVPAGVTQITESMITDLRLNEDMCGYVLSNFKPRNIVVTADDVTDTDTHLIPVKTKPREQSLRGDGSYSDDLTNNTIGNYKFIRDGDAFCIIYDVPSVVSLINAPSGYNIISSLGTSNLNRMLNNTDNTNYATITAGSTASNWANFQLYFANIRDFLDSSKMVNGADITLKIKFATENSSYTINSYYIALWNFDSNSEVPDTRRNITASATARTETFTYHFNTYNDLFNIGFVISLRLNSGVSGRDIYVYGADLIVAYNVPYKTLLKIDPFKVTSYNYESGSAAVMGMQAMTETLLEVQGEPENTTFTEPEEDIPPHGTSPETALPYVKSVYMSGEYMVYEDKTYRCLEDNTVHPPSIQAVAHKWELVV